MKSRHNISLNHSSIICLLFFIIFHLDVKSQVVLNFSNSSGNGVYIGGGTGAGTVGAIYKWLNVGTDGSVTIDATIEIVSRFGNATLTSIDGSSSPSDWEPQISGPLTTSGNSYGFEFKISFFNQANALPYTLPSLVAQAIDIDGGGSGSALREFSTFKSPMSYTLESPTNLTVTNELGGYKFRSGQSLFNGISISATEFIASSSYMNVNSINVVCGVEAEGGSCSGNRLFSFNFRNVVSFSDPINTLPIELTEFKGSSIGYGRILIEWVTASESNNDYFTLERLDENKNVEVISTIKAMGTSFSSIIYNTYDYTANKNIVYYRLKQTDFNGKFELFEKMIGIDNRLSNKKVIKTTNLLGQDIDENYKGMVIDVYEDNTTSKRLQ